MNQKYQETIDVYTRFIKTYRSKKVRTHHDYYFYFHLRKVNIDVYDRIEFWNEEKPELNNHDITEVLKLESIVITKGQFYNLRRNLRLKWILNDHEDSPFETKQ